MDYTLLVMLLKDLAILPFQEIKLELKDEISKTIVKLSSKKYNNRLLVVLPSSNGSNASVDDLPSVGVATYIKSQIELSNGNLRLTLRGEKRVKVLRYQAFSEDIIAANLTDIILPKFEPNKEEVIKRKLKESLLAYINSSKSISNSIIKTIEDNDNLDFLTDVITSFLPLSPVKKNEYMKELNSEKRAISLIKDLKIEIEYNKLEESLDNNVEVRLTKEQEEYYLKEKLKEIEDVLNISKDNESQNKYLELLNSLDIPEKTHDKLAMEIDRLNKMTVNSPEYGVLVSYLDWTLNLPWNKQSIDNLNEKSILSHLNKSHYGLEEVKERIIEYINVKNINPLATNPIICLVGPPGIGKTTITKSIAEALNREFLKISVAGLNDATELSGSRRTYLGALPGKIMQGIKKCGVNNPVILIDEVDKMVKDFKGDPASILLDVLDSNQNKNFVDNYIEEPFDLSNVLFILTANSINNIPYTLYDRLEVINLSSYTVFEKVDIAKKFILPKIYAELKMSKKLIMKDETLIYLINSYTKEAGVRNLTRVLKSLVTKVIASKKDSLTITNTDINHYLKEPLYEIKPLKISISGMVNALAYTDLGGSILKVEASIYNGEEKVITTGALGDVLKESILVATSFIKESDYVSSTVFYNRTIHIHVLEGAVKKEGPSCGVAITTALLSKLLDIKVSNEIAFTGEITLKGNILPIGGLKEKLIAAYNGGIKKVFIPSDNANDLLYVPKQIIDNIEIKLVSNYQMIYEELFKNNIA